MFKRCISRPSIYSGVPLRHRCIPQHRANISQLSEPKSHNDNNNNGSNQKPPESWARFIGTRAGAIVVGYIVGKVYYYYNPKPDDSFSAYELTSRDPISSTLSIFTVRPKDGGASVKNADEIRQAWKSGIWNLQFKQPQLQIVRAYTPLPLGNVEETNSLQFLIRRDPRGEVSGYLHRLSPSSEIEMRGPNVEYPISSNTRNVIFIAGGTGIAPALQVAHTMFTASDANSLNSQEDSPPKYLHVLWANRSREDTINTAAQPNPIINHWNTLTATHNTHSSASSSTTLTVTYFTDEDKTFITPAVLSSALDTALSHANNNHVTPTSTGPRPAPETQIIISGPEGFISYLAGPKVWKDGKETQGPLGGIMGSVLEERRRRGKDGGGGVDGGKVKVWKV